MCDNSIPVERITEQVDREKQIDQYVKCFTRLENGKIGCLIENWSATFSGNTAAIKHLKKQHESVACCFCSPPTAICK